MEPSEQFREIINSNYSHDELEDHETHSVMHNVHHSLTVLHNSMLDAQRRGVDIPKDVIQHAKAVATLFHAGLAHSQAAGYVTIHHPSGATCLTCGEHMATPWVSRH